MCSQRKIYSMHMNAKCERFKLKFIVKYQRSARKYAMRMANRLPRTHTNTHTFSWSLFSMHCSRQEASIIQNIRNFERLSTIAPSSANHAQFVKIISSLVTIFFFILSLASLHFLYPTYPLGECVRDGIVSWEIGRGLLSDLQIELAHLSSYKV